MALLVRVGGRGVAVPPPSLSLPPLAVAARDSVAVALAQPLKLGREDCEAVPLGLGVPLGMTVPLRV